MSATATQPQDVGLSDAELKALFPKWNRRPSYRARALRRDVRAFAQTEIRRMRLQTSALEMWLERQADGR